MHQWEGASWFNLMERKKGRGRPKIKGNDMSIKEVTKDILR